MHFLMNSANLKSNFKLYDVFACFIADLIHDYEHPGYTNQFVIRTKHPLAIRYSDTLVLEQHHLAAAFQIMFNGDDTNLFENIPIET
jgi:hypothetical protein